MYGFQVSVICLDHAALTPAVFAEPAADSNDSTDDFMPWHGGLVTRHVTLNPGEDVIRQTA